MRRIIQILSGRPGSEEVTRTRAGGFSVVCDVCTSIESEAITKPGWVGAQKRALIKQFGSVRLPSLLATAGGGSE